MCIYILSFDEICVTFADNLEGRLAKFDLHPAEILDGANVPSNHQILVCPGILEVFLDHLGDVGDLFHLVDRLVSQGLYVPP